MEISKAPVNTLCINVLFKHPKILAFRFHKSDLNLIAEPDTKNYQDGGMSRCCVYVVSKNFNINSSLETY